MSHIGSKKFFAGYVQNLPDATPPRGKIYQFSNIAIYVELINKVVGPYKIECHKLVTLETSSLTVCVWRRRTAMGGKG